MHAVLCDLCGKPMRGRAYEVHVIRGEAVNGDQGTLRIAQRGTSRMHFFCGSCGGWLQGAMDHLRNAYQDVEAVAGLLDP
jgi:hypothetical protein